jgi:beta-glucosidase
MMRELAQLVVPAITWHPDSGFAHEDARIAEARAMGVGGFVLPGGREEDVRALTKRLQRESPHRLLIAADMERGAGQQFHGATGLPPIRAIAQLNDMEALRRAARLTAREARTMGVNWNLAPVSAVTRAGESAVLGARAFGHDVDHVSALVSAWIEACQSEGVLSCAKHFPGLGRIKSAAGQNIPVVQASLEELKRDDMAPFRAAIGSGVASIMIAFATYPALDASGRPAVLSREVVQWLLRQQLGFQQLVIADFALMRNSTTDVESDRAVMAVQAGVDILLRPTDPEAVVAALDRARTEGRLDADVAQLALRRRLKWSQWASPPNDWRRPSGADTAWGALVADRCVRVERGPLPQLSTVTEVIIVDDDEGIPGVHAPRTAVVEAMRALGLDARLATEPSAVSLGPVVVALFAHRSPHKVRNDLSERSVLALQQVVSRSAAMQRQVILLMLGEAEFAEAACEAHGWTMPVVQLWSGDSCMQRAAARKIAGR